MTEPLDVAQVLGAVALGATLGVTIGLLLVRAMGAKPTVPAPAPAAALHAPVAAVKKPPSPAGDALGGLLLLGLLAALFSAGRRAGPNRRGGP